VRVFFPLGSARVSVRGGGLKVLGLLEGEGGV
jgi:hypothetical protein